jgi:hypothetical protein
MKHRSPLSQQHASLKEDSTPVEILPLSDRNPGDAFLRREIESNRRSERWLVLKAVIALAFVAALVLLRLAYYT